MSTRDGVEAALVRRSQLFVPANKTSFIGRATRFGADATILDLEDSVPSAQRQAARSRLADALRRLSQDGQDIYVRVNNHVDSLVSDVEAAVSEDLRGLMIPKAESAEELHAIDALVTQAEIHQRLAPGSIELQVVIESCKGLQRLESIAASCARTVSLTLGVEDLATELEIDPQSPAFDLRWAHGQILMAARAQGLAPYGLLRSLANYNDTNAFSDDVSRSKQFGYVGALCIHPRQVPIVNAGFAPSDAEIAEAQDIVAAFTEAQQGGTGAIGRDGRMIDLPVASRARRVLARARQDRAFSNGND